jgi:hypothetical protein
MGSRILRAISAWWLFWWLLAFGMHGDDLQLFAASCDIAQNGQKLT